MPLEDAPGSDEAMASIQGKTPLNRDQQNLLRDLFEYLEVAHEHTARACSMLAHLSPIPNSPTTHGDPESSDPPAHPGECPKGSVRQSKNAKEIRSSR